MLTRLFVLAIAACTYEPSSFVMQVAAGGPALRHDCELAERRCARCHSIERVERAQIVVPRQWRDYVHRMRLMPGSNVPPDEERPITRCLVFRTSGQPGLDELAAEDR